MARTEAEWFGNSALESYPALAEGTPLLEIPGNISYLPGTTAVLEKVFPSLANQIPTPMDFLAAQLQLSSIQLSWQFTAKATGTMVQGVQSLVNSQV